MGQVFRCIFVVIMLIKLSENLEFLKYITFNTLYDTKSILEGSGYKSGLMAMLLIATILYIIGIIWFQKKTCHYKIIIRNLW